MPMPAGTWTLHKTVEECSQNFLDDDRFLNAYAPLILSIVVTMITKHQSYHHDYDQDYDDNDDDDDNHDGDKQTRDPSENREPKAKTISECFHAFFFRRNNQ